MRHWRHTTALTVKFEQIQRTNLPANFVNFKQIPQIILLVSLLTLNK